MARRKSDDDEDDLPKPKKKARKDDAPDKPKKTGPRDDAWTGILALTFLALVGAAALFYLDFEELASAQPALATRSADGKVTLKNPSIVLPVLGEKPAEPAVDPLDDGSTKRKPPPEPEPAPMPPAEPEPMPMPPDPAAPAPAPAPAPPP